MLSSKTSKRSKFRGIEMQLAALELARLILGTKSFDLPHMAISPILVV